MHAATDEWCLWARLPQVMELHPDMPSGDEERFKKVVLTLTLAFALALALTLTLRESYNPHRRLS